MKDRNSKELQVGDVCVLHSSNDDTFKECWHGCLVVVDYIDEHDFDNEYPINCLGIEPEYVTGTDFNQDELEIIGSVRDE